MEEMLVGHYWWMGGLVGWWVGSRTNMGIARLHTHCESAESGITVTNSQRSECGKGEGEGRLVAYWNHKMYMYKGEKDARKRNMQNARSTLILLSPFDEFIGWIICFV